MKTILQAFIVLIITGYFISANATTKIRGYYDFELRHDKTSPGAVKTNPAFSQHHLSTFIQADEDIFTIFAEIEYEFAPSLENNKYIGKILAETVWGKVAFSQEFQMTMGYFITPTWWGTYHYPNIVHAIERPTMVKKLIPFTDNGIMFHGEKWMGAGNLGYNLWFGNGEGESTPANTNDDNAFSKGLKVQYKDFGGLAVSELSLIYALYPKNAATGNTESTMNGLEGVFEVNNFGINFAHHTKKVKNATLTESGNYIMPSYRIPLKAKHTISPFLMIDSYSEISGTALKQTDSSSLGFKYDYGPSASVKVQYRTKKVKDATGDPEEGAWAQFAYFFN